MYIYIYGYRLPVLDYVRGHPRSRFEARYGRAGRDIKALTVWDLGEP